MARIFVIEDDKMMAECIVRAIRRGLRDNSKSDHLDHDVQVFTNAIEAMSALNDSLPDLIFLDILLSGPNGFSFLNELTSYTDTMKIPVVVVTSIDLQAQDLSHYGVIDVLQKETMTPDTISANIKRALVHV